MQPDDAPPRKVRMMKVLYSDREFSNEIIRNDLENAGFQVQWNLNGNLIVSLNRHLAAREVKTALRDADYDDCQYSIKQRNHLVIVAAVIK